MDPFNLFIDGKIASPVRGQYFDSINPATGEAWAKVADATEDDMVRAIAAARQADDNGFWANMPVRERGGYLRKIARVIRKNAKELALLESRDTGKPIRHTTYIDVPTCANTFENFGKMSGLLRSRRNPVAAPVRSQTEYEPVGVVGAVIPWNYPLIMFGWKVAPALAAGNTVILKPSSQASVAIARLAQLIQDINLPPGVLNILTSTHHEATAHMVKSHDVDMISFTGGTQTGREIMRLAASVPKKVALELGGKSPSIVFADCNFKAAVGGVLSAIFLNQGQMCTAGSRLLIEDKIYNDFLAELIKRAQALKLGDPLDAKTQFGPLIGRRHRDQVLDFVTRGVQEGARVACGGKVPEDSGLSRGAYMEPTILTEVSNDMSPAQMEIFGPVLCVMRFSSLEEAVGIANDTDYGLAANVWTRDKEKARLVAKQLKCGTVWINTYGGFYDQAPYGGVKQSGFGRELGAEGLMEYVQPKHVCMDTTPGGAALVTRWFSPMNAGTVFVFIVTNILTSIKKFFAKN